MKIIEIPVFADNYAYLIIDKENGVAAAVDPAVPEKVLEAAEKEGVKITTVLTTHHHWDHSGGNGKIAAAIQDIKVVGGDTRIEALNHQVGNGDIVQISNNIKVKVFSTPCHTTGHVLYLAEDKDQTDKALFTGDTLFIAGCGRFFEGTAEQMNKALNEVIASLPDETLVYSGHEYTKKNLEFALSIEPDNLVVQNKYQSVCKKRDSGFPTVPSTVGEEKTYNPFMRVSEEAMKSALKMEGKNSIDVMAELRLRKDNF